MAPTWLQDAVVYHIYPFGLTGAPRRNDFGAAPVPRLEQLYPWLDHIQGLGANTLYLGPLFESSAHGYDTADYFQVDRRLGDRETLSNLAREIHRRGMRLVLDGVFNHVGRDFWAFKDVLANRERSPYAGWFSNLDFSRSSPYQDAFSYEGWNGNFDLVKLNLTNPAVRGHLFDAVRVWVQEFEIDGLRLDAADQLAPDFLVALSAHCRALKADFWLMGEIVFGDYRALANPQMLDSATNYEGYKSLYSSHVDHNYFEIAYALKRQFGPDGIYRNLPLYSFADNHDVNRVASSLKDPRLLYPLYCLLFCMPGVPSIYYGSEWGITGERTSHSDLALRPQLDLGQAASFPNHGLARTIARLAEIRHNSQALRQGDYQELYVVSEQFAFMRSAPDQQMVVMVNSAAGTAPGDAGIELRLPVRSGKLVDWLNKGEVFQIDNFQAYIASIPSTWARILEIQS